MSNHTERENSDRDALRRAGEAGPDREVLRLHDLMVRTLRRGIDGLGTAHPRIVEADYIEDEGDETTVEDEYGDTYRITVAVERVEGDGDGNRD